MTALTDSSRQVRLAAHELINACAEVVNPIQLSLGLAYNDSLSKPLRGVVPKPLPEEYK